MLCNVMLRSSELGHVSLSNAIWMLRYLMGWNDMCCQFMLYYCVLSILFPFTRIRMFVGESLIVLCHVSLPGKRKTLSEESTFAYLSLWLLSDSDRFLQVFFAPSLTYVPARQ